MIPEDEIDFEDIRPYHKVNMYKKMVRYYLGLMVRSLRTRIKPEVGSTIKGAFPKQDEIRESYGSCEEEKRSIHFPIEEDVEYTYLGSFSCYLFQCEERSRIHTYKLGKTVFVCGGEGARFIDIRNYKYTEDHPNTYGEKNKVISYVHLAQMLMGLKDYLYDVEQIVFMGHSNGMASSILTAFLFCCMKNKEFYLKNENSFDEHGKKFIEDSKEIFKDILDKLTIYVVGTGGFPVLFETQSKFREFYDEIKGRYVHIVNGFLGDETIYADYYSSPILSLINMKFGLYYSTQTPDISFYYNYNGTKCSYDKILIDDVNAGYEGDNKIWKWVKNGDRRPEFENRITTEKAFIPDPLFAYKHKDIKFLTADELKKNRFLERIHLLSSYRDSLTIYFFS